MYFSAWDSQILILLCMRPVQVALAWPHCLMVVESRCGGEGVGMGARSGGVYRPGHAQHVPNNRCTIQSHLLSISLTFSLDAVPTLGFFHPWNETNLPVLPPSSHQSLGFSWPHTTVTLLWFLPWENKELHFPETYSKVVSFITNSLSSSIPYLL